MTQPDHQYLRFEVEDTIATVWLSRGPVNAVNQDMYLELQHLFSHVEALGPDIRAIVLAADGPHFCAGNDLEEFETLTPENSRVRMFNSREAFWAIRECEVPVIAAVHGVALGTGCAISASCDVVIAADDAKIGLPEIKVGVMGGGKHLSRLLPQGLVRYMFFTGEPLPATEFVRFGGVLRTVPADALLEEARAVARSMARHSPVALRLAKRGLNEIEYMPLKTGYELEQGLTGALSAHPHAKEALAAFRERREPDYSDATVMT
jgi:enoyl-CoA hydratase